MVQEKQMNKLLSRLKLHLNNFKPFKNPPADTAAKALRAAGLLENAVRYSLPGNFKPRLTQSFPAVVLCEVTNHCNLACSMCFNATMKRRKGFMDIKLYRKIADEVAEHRGVFFQPLGSGEPLLHPDFPEMLRYAKEKGIKPLGTTTNATLLTPEMTDRIIDYLDVIFISLDSMDSNKLEKIRKGAKFDRLISNIRYFMEKKKEKGKPFSVLNFVLMEETAGDLEGIRTEWGGIFDEIQVFECHSWINSVKGEHNPAKLKGFPCYQLWNQMFVCWDGRVNLCCKDPEAREIMGDAAKEKLVDIWHSDKYNRLRDVMVRNELKGTLCAQCNEFWKWPFQK